MFVRAHTCVCTHAQGLVLNTIKLPLTHKNYLNIVFHFIFEQYLTFNAFQNASFLLWLEQYIILVISVDSVFLFG
jgi:hypothetical protein